jgi:hypothetical protein
MGKLNIHSKNISFIFLIKYKGTSGENISYGQKSPMDVVL